MKAYNNNYYPTPVEDEQPEGFTLNWPPLALLALLMLTGYIKDWTFIAFLTIVVIIHELGHVVMGTRFGCRIKEMQVFFFAFLSYKPHEGAGGGWWRKIKWSLGVLPWGGFTIFDTFPVADEDAENENQTRPIDPTSPYLNDKSAWQRLLISAGGVLFNLATFLVFYFLVLVIPADTWYTFCRPIAFLSMMLALLNLLPIYPLDGGAILFALYEILTGHRPAPGFVKVCGIIGGVIVVLLFWVFPQVLSGFVQNVLGTIF